jgi:hypothetical protein
VEAETIEEEAVHRLPFEILPERTEQVAFADSISKNGESDIAKDPENQDD